MSEMIWIPGLAVLAVGMAAGLFWALRLRRTGTGRDGRRDTADLELRLADFEAQKAAIYARLRSSEEELTDEAERADLERQAARILRSIDALREQLGKPQARARGQKAAALAADQAAAAAAPTLAPARRAGNRSMITGFAAGAAVAAVIGLLVYWAVRDAKPATSPMGGGGQPMQAGPAPGADEHPGEGEAPQELAQQILELESRLTANPEDLVTRKRLALARLAAGQFFRAYKDSEEILGANPEDPDALYIQAAVRMEMGQFGPAVELLDRVLAQYPDHLLALLQRGIALYRQGNVEQAVDTWEYGLEASGGSQPQFEQLLDMVRSGVDPFGDQPAAEPATTAPAAPAAPAAAPGAPPSRPAATAGDTFGVHIELAGGVQPAAGSTLFVFLRGAAGGPPAAVRRIADPTFPVDLALGQADSMMGAELPDSGLLVVRLDGDGSVTTRDPSDLESSVSAVRGEVARVVLGG